MRLHSTVLYCYMTSNRLLIFVSCQSVYFLSNVMWLRGNTHTHRLTRKISLQGTIKIIMTYANGKMCSYIKSPHTQKKKRKTCNSTQHTCRINTHLKACVLKAKCCSYPCVVVWAAECVISIRTVWVPDNWKESRNLSHPVKQPHTHTHTPPPSHTLGNQLQLFFFPCCLILAVLLYKKDYIAPHARNKRMLNMVKGWYVSQTFAGDFDVVFRIPLGFLCLLEICCFYHVFACISFRGETMWVLSLKHCSQVLALASYFAILFFLNCSHMMCENYWA